MFAGAPDYVNTVAGTGFISTQRNADAMGLLMKLVPVECHNRIGKVERIHA